MKGLHTGTEKAEPTWKEWRREFCWEEEPVLAVSGVRLELPEGIPGLRRLERWCRRLEGVGGPLGAGALSQGLHGRPAGQGGLPSLPAVGGIPHRRRDPPHPGVPEPVL